MCARGGGRPSKVLGCAAILPHPTPAAPAHSAAAGSAAWCAAGPGGSAAAAPPPAPPAARSSATGCSSAAADGSSSASAAAAASCLASPCCAPSSPSAASFGLPAACAWASATGAPAPGLGAASEGCCSSAPPPLAAAAASSACPSAAAAAGSSRAAWASPSPALAPGEAAAPLSGLAAAPLPALLLLLPAWTAFGPSSTRSMPASLPPGERSAATSSCSCDPPAAGCAACSVAAICCSCWHSPAWRPQSSSWQLRPPAALACRRKAGSEADAQVQCPMRWRAAAPHFLPLPCLSASTQNVLRPLPCCPALRLPTPCSPRLLTIVHYPAAGAAGERGALVARSAARAAGRCFWRGCRHRDGRCCCRRGRAIKARARSVPKLDYQLLRSCMRKDGRHSSR